MIEFDQHFSAYTRMEAHRVRRSGRRRLRLVDRRGPVSW